MCNLISFARLLSEKTNVSSGTLLCFLSIFSMGIFIICNWSGSLVAKALNFASVQVVILFKLFLLMASCLMSLN